jgi:hypothetical protein
MKSSLLAVIGAVALFTGASTASAAGVTVTYQGVVDAVQSNGLPMPDYDVAGLFGGGNLEGENFTAVISYDTNLGIETTDGATYDQLVGGGGFYDVTDNLAYASPITSEVFTIKGYSYTFSPDYYSVVSTQSGSGGYIQQIGDATDGAESILDLPTSAAPASLGISFSATGPGFGYLLTAFSADNSSDSIVFATTSAVVDAAPEPLTWILMVAGIGLIGIMLRGAQREGELDLLF